MGNKGGHWWRHDIFLFYNSHLVRIFIGTFTTDFCEYFYGRDFAISINGSSFLTLTKVNMMTLNCKSIIDINHFSYYHKYTIAFLPYCLRRGKVNSEILDSYFIELSIKCFLSWTESLLRICIEHLLTHTLSFQKKFVCAKKQRKFYIWYAN